MRIAVPVLTPKRKSPADKRRELRDEIWPDAEAVVWNRQTDKGWCTIPRTLPLLMTLINYISPKERGDASRVYQELWCHAFEEGLVSIVDEEAHAFASGFINGSRSLRSWRERMDLLSEFGFIRIARNGGRLYGYVLLVHPHDVVQRLRVGGKYPFPPGWDTAFAKRFIDIGAVKRAKAGSAKNVKKLAERAV